jgi:hypothetical protein
MEEAIIKERPVIRPEIELLQETLRATWIARDL